MPQCGYAINEVLFWTHGGKGEKRKKEFGEWSESKCWSKKARKVGTTVGAYCYALHMFMCVNSCFSPAVVEFLCHFVLLR